MTLAMCDMKMKDEKAQTLFWTKFNAICKQHKVEEVKFTGFMANATITNCNAMRVVYNNG
jgi:hypothetical protein